jgi:hypothetical protein
MSLFECVTREESKKKTSRSLSRRQQSDKTVSVLSFDKSKQSREWTNRRMRVNELESIVLFKITHVWWVGLDRSISWIVGESKTTSATVLSKYWLIITMLIFYFSQLKAFILHLLVTMHTINEFWLSIRYWREKCQTWLFVWSNNRPSEMYSPFWEQSFYVISQNHSFVQTWFSQQYEQRLISKPFRWR